jgi:hypothetical protein
MWFHVCLTFQLSIFINAKSYTLAVLKIKTPQHNSDDSSQFLYIQSLTTRSSANTNLVSDGFQLKWRSPPPPPPPQPSHYILCGISLWWRIGDDVMKLQGDSCWLLDPSDMKPTDFILKRLCKFYLSNTQLHFELNALCKTDLIFQLYCAGHYCESVTTVFTHIVISGWCVSTLQHLNASHYISVL